MSLLSLAKVHAYGILLLVFSDKKLSISDKNKCPNLSFSDIVMVSR